MTLFAKLAEKPWLDNSSGPGDAPLISPYKLGLRFFLGVVTVIFFLLTVAYGGRMALEGAEPPPDINLLWPNTIALVLSSVALQWALFSARRWNEPAVRQGLIAGGFFGLCFIGGQLVAWQQLASSDYFTMSSPAIGFFYLITGLHGLHILGGLAALGAVAFKTLQGADFRDRTLSIEVCTTYFHFMLAVWLVLFALVFTGENMELLLVLCGLK